MTALGYSLGFTALAAFGSTLALEVTQAPAGVLGRVLSAAPLRAVGRVSYGMYLVHFPVLDLVQPRVFGLFPPRKGPILYTLLVTAGVAVFSFAVAYALHRFYERPFLRLKARFTPAREPIAGAAALSAPVAGAAGTGPPPGR